eukprot:CAMPEP_0119529972 /NCGR_PEP_ID=MMETSP1344-20130328/43880_1 /TAXON_ID=236787 /ORGANISM="Florenciella parvula, Strain CCMP2471" /LENGTH=53 /DNA_ID=CAMNT_0007569749 /DNA_START=51 /DNA_END=209 /DNA_ORIENTATION=-
MALARLLEAEGLAAVVQGETTDVVMNNDDALATFFGVLKSADPELAQQLQEEL